MCGFYISVGEKHCCMNEYSYWDKDFLLRSYVFKLCNRIFVCIAVYLNYNRILETHGFQGQKGLLGDLIVCNVQEMRLNFTKLPVFF